MKIVYFGSSEFSCIVLEGICRKGFMPSLIVSQPDRPKGRGLKVFPTKVSCFAQDNKIPVIKPSGFDEKTVGRIRSEGADLFLVADYGKILPASLLSVPKIMSLCVHPSLLPKYRGSAPIDWAIINGEKETGVTIFKINEKVDSGEILLQEKVAIADSDDIFSLISKLADKGACLLIEAIVKIEHNNYSFTPQDENKVIFAPKLTKQDGRIDWNRSAIDIRNLVRATLGWPSAYTYYQDQLLKIVKTEVIEGSSDQVCGSIVKIDKQGISVATGSDVLLIKKVKPQGKKEMDAYSFVCGHKIKLGERFS